MNELIKVDKEKKTVDARELYKLLGSKYQFADWIKENIAGFIENQDYVIISVKTEKKGRPRKDYHLSIDMAKNICMLSRTKKGHEIRLYFIEIEKRYYTEIGQVNYNNKELLAKSKENRKSLTNEWKNHEAKNYGFLTIAEYDAIFDNKDIRKKDMTDSQKTMLSAFEYIESLKLNKNKELKGDEKLSRSLIETGNAIKNIIDHKENKPLDVF